MAVFTSSTAGQNVMLAGVAGKQWVMARYHMESQLGTNSAQFFSSGGTAISGIKYFPNAGDGSSDHALSQSVEWSPETGLFATLVGEGLNINIGAATQISLDYQVFVV
jgi:hypothetical protein